MTTAKCHKLPPVPGWYAVALLHGKRKELEVIGSWYFSEREISETPEQKNVRYYGPLPIEDVETNG